MMEVQQNPMKKKIVGALLLHALTLLGFADLAYLDYLTIPILYFNSRLAFLSSLTLAVLGMIALVMAVWHYTEELGTLLLKNWGLVHIFFLVCQIVPFTMMLLLFYFPLPLDSVLVTFISYLILLFPPLLIYNYTGRVRSPKYELPDLV